MKQLDITTIYSLPFVPHSVRMPARLMRIIRDDAKKNGRTLSSHMTAILVDYINGNDDGK